MARELALIVLALAACDKDAGSGGDHQAAKAVPPGAPALAEQAFFRLEAAPQPACTAGTTCEARLVLRALGDYHVNDQYPFKFVPDASPGLEVDGTGTFARDGDQAGTMTVKFRAAKPGTAKLSGTFKLSVCTEENCEIATPKIAFDVTAS